MNRQSEWLFEAPFVLESDHDTNPSPVEKPCKTSWAVWGFDAGKEKPGPKQEKLIENMVKDIGRMLKAELKGKSAIVDLRIHFEGHVDKTTDPANFGTLDDDRASWVWASVLSEIETLKKILPGVQLEKRFSKSAAGWSRPFKSDSGAPTLPIQNRRVSVCVNWTIKPPPKQSAPAIQKKIDIEMTNLEYYYPELESEWGLPESSNYSYPLGEDEWEQAASCPDQNNLAIWISRFARYGNTIQALPREEQARIGQIARQIISSYGPGCQPIRTIRLIGHADRDLQRGAAFEKKISGDRAGTVQAALIRAINNPAITQQITWQRIAEGANRLVVFNPKTEAERARNRRVEVFLETSQSSQPSCSEECVREFQRCLQTPSTREQCLRRLRSCRRDCRGRPA